MKSDDGLEPAPAADLSVDSLSFIFFKVGQFQTPHPQPLDADYSSHDADVSHFGIASSLLQTAFKYLCFRPARWSVFSPHLHLHSSSAHSSSSLLYDQDESSSRWRYPESVCSCSRLLAYLSIYLSIHLTGNFVSSQHLQTWFFLYGAAGLRGVASDGAAADKMFVEPR